MPRAAVGAIGLLVGVILGVLDQPPRTRVVVDRALPDVAMASPAEHTIVINPLRLGMLPPGVANFVLLHEQGHVALGHDLHAVGDRSRRQELAADCWAARRLGDHAARVATLMTLGPLPGDSTHPTGEARAAEVLQCSP